MYHVSSDVYAYAEVLGDDHDPLGNSPKGRENNIYICKDEPQGVLDIDNSEIAEDGITVLKAAWKEDTAMLARAARRKRNKLIAETDWLVARAVEEGLEVPTNVKAYRQALRDLPDQPGFPLEIDWPELEL